MPSASANTADIASIAAQLNEYAESGKVEVPLLPEIAHRVMMLTQDPDSDASQLANIIQSDPTLGGHVMRIANSAAYTPNSNLVSIQQAVARLGMVEISNIALSTSLNSKLFNAPGYEKTIAVIWQHALATALWSKEVARSMRSNVEAAFLCGLLHSIGKPVILQTIAEHKNAGVTALDQQALDTLFEQFERRYCDIVTAEWELPAIVAEALSYYKNYTEAPTQAALAATIALGSELASCLLNPDTCEPEQVRNSAALDIVNLYPEEVEQLLAKSDSVKANMDALSL